ncbi:Jerky protein homolog-like [Eumeta japonica]|uniref:Jerky protein homolog-like n=1 Tax=Eumeta variegata TaxID=151549 RepID=A0A4C1UUE2_EUMVA|nr:Jerky protein homolog-like [Eumeta japonica]
MGSLKRRFLPPNVTSLLQPMDQSVIETMKRHYRRQLLRKLLIGGAEDEELVLANHSKINLKDSCYMVAEAWSLVTPVTLRRAWNKLKGLPSEKNKKKESEENEKQEYGEDDDDEDALSLEEIRKNDCKIPGCTEVSAEDVGEWMACDTSDPGFQILNDDEIVVSVREDVEVEVEEELSADVEVDAGPSASEAFAGLETALKWMERQPECDHLQLLNVKRMRDLTARKRLKTAKQLTLTEMFKKTMIFISKLVHKDITAHAVTCGYYTRGVFLAGGPVVSECSKSGRVRNHAQLNGFIMRATLALYPPGLSTLRRVRKWVCGRYRFSGVAISSGEYFPYFV